MSSPSELYPGRSAVVCEMLAAWKDRNVCASLERDGLEHPEHGHELTPEFWRGATASSRAWLRSLRHVWHALRPAR